ncbi:MAG: 3-methyl-2-oxobutanoate hydroxymethyltransferase, partial [Pseudomonas sp.]
PRFVKQYADVGRVIREACVRYAEDVRSGSFPEMHHCYGA